MRREYVLRVSATLAFLFGWVIIPLGVALVPTYVLVKAQIKAYDIEAGRESESEDAFKSVESEVEMSNEVLTQLKVQGQTLYTSEVIDEVKRQTPRGIEYRTFYATEKNGTIQSLQVQGTAPTREALASLKTALETSDLFERVELPIADLARESDLSFAITITLKNVVKK